MYNSTVLHGRSKSRRIFLLFSLLIITSVSSFANDSDNSDARPPLAKSNQPLRVGVVGLVHTHVHWILGREEKGDITIVGIVEPNRELAKKYSEQHGFSMDLVFDSLEEMVAKTDPQAVTAFNTIYDHLETVKFCAPRGIHVMVEKPLAVNYEHAKEMASLARKHNIALLTNYESSWYPSAHEAYAQLNGAGTIGTPRKIVFHTGHQGPIEIGVNSEFLEWLIDPVMNGGGALTDFGCYGANISTWLLDGKTPTSVSCTTQQFKPEKYPKVEDEATIVLTYPETQVIIQASWNWPHAVKDMEIYGTSGSLRCPDGSTIISRQAGDNPEQPLTAVPLPEGKDDPFSLLAKVVLEQYELPAYDLSSLENNLVVMQILEAAKVSARTGKTIQWSEFFKED
ncbi:MAG: Gfo/Idh/MocA family oxidoreductase [Flavobacteriaceae bacterium]|nr:Gfo/Idh/MocA family oxidoreductase [Flavobacteriaceae bacterium]